MPDDGQSKAFPDRCTRYIPELGGQKRCIGRPFLLERAVRQCAECRTHRSTCDPHDLIDNFVYRCESSGTEIEGTSLNSGSRRGAQQSFDYVIYVDPVSKPPATAELWTVIA